MTLPLAAATAATERAPSFSERVSVQWLPTEELLCHLAGNFPFKLDQIINIVCTLCIKHLSSVGSHSCCLTVHKLLTASRALVGVKRIPTRGFTMRHKDMIMTNCKVCHNCRWPGRCFSGTRRQHAALPGGARQGGAVRRAWHRGAAGQPAAGAAAAAAGAVAQHSRRLPAPRRWLLSPFKCFTLDFGMSSRPLLAAHWSDAWQEWHDFAPWKAEASVQRALIFLAGTGSDGSSQEVVLLDVGSVRRRAACSALAAQGGLTAGSGQWLGLVVTPLADVLHHAQLQLSAFGPPGTALPTPIVFVTNSNSTFASQCATTLSKRHSWASLLTIVVSKTRMTAPQLLLWCQATEHCSCRITGSGLPAVHLPLSQAAVVAPFSPSIVERSDASTPAANTRSGQPAPQQVEVKRGAIQLPDWAARQPAVVWLRVQAGQPNTLSPAIAEPWKAGCVTLCNTPLRRADALLSKTSVHTHQCAPFATAKL